MKILVVNAGSSTHKLSLYDIQNDEPIEPLWQGSIDWGRKDQRPFLMIQTHQANKIERKLKSCSVEEGITVLLNSLCQGETQVIESLSAIKRIGHRIVHGGMKFEQPIPITSWVKKQIRQLIPLAPLHNPASLQGIELMEKFFPSILQVGVFDTAFHVIMPEMIKTYPIPWKWKKKGIQRYGFHGISHQYCAEQAAKLLKENLHVLKIINCHLGNGCSLCAIKEGKSYETTMGLTPLEGLMMGTRCGSIDPGILLYLLREHHLSQDELADCLTFDSGLKGIGGSSDMRELLEKKHNGRVQLALDMFIHRLKTSIGALAISLDGCDVLTFTGGIGEHAAFIREKACQGLTCLSIALDQEKNRLCRPDADITARLSRTRVLVIHTREEWMIARACLHI